jgi:O-antigen/teichoic acid export membrane protein
MVTVLAGFLFVPVSVAYLGVEGFGAWESVTAVSNLGVILFAPAASSVLWLVASNPPEARLRTARSTALQAMAYCLFSALMFSGGVLVLGDDLARWLQLPSASMATTEGKARILGFACLAQGLIGASDCAGYALGGLGRLRHATLVRTGGLMLNYGVSLFLLARGHGLTSLLYGLLTMGGFGLFLNCLLLFRGPCDDRTTTGSLFSPRTIRYGATLLLGFFAGIGKDSADRIISSGLASPVFTATLGLSNRLSIILGEVNRYAYTPLIPAVAAASSEGNIERVHMLFERCMAYNAFAAGLMTTVLISNSELLLRSWTGVLPERSHLVTVTVAAGVVMQLMLTGPATAVLRGLGKVRQETTYVGLGLGLNIALSLVLIPMLQAYGKILATSLAVGISSLVFVGLVYRSQVLPPLPFLRAFLLYSLSLSLGFGAHWLRAHYDVEIPAKLLTPSGITSLVLPGVVFALVSLITLPSLRGHVQWLVKRMILRTGITR